MPPFERLHHVCIVVHDIDRTRAFYESIGVGPWRKYPPLTDYAALDAPKAFLQLQYQACNLANVQLQLCQPPPEDCPQRRFLDERGEGVFHLGFDADDCDEAEAQAVALGLAPLMRGRRSDHSGFTFFDTAGQAGVTLEVRAAAPAPAPK